MNDSSWSWDDARSVETSLADGIENALREAGLDETTVRDIMDSRETAPESLRPVTKREIEWRREESQRLAREMGLKIPRLVE